MRILSLAILFFSSFFVAHSAQKPDAPAPNTPLRAADLAWMSGDWETTDGKTQIDEHWTHVAGGSLFGTSRVVVGEKTVFFEFLRIETRAEGVFYVAQPRGGAPTDFKLVRIDGSSAVFENPSHDFPKRIRYERDADAGLVARIEGDGSETERPRTFAFRRRAAH